MKPYYQDDLVTIYHGDCRDVLPGLEPVDLVLTDPPYPDWLTNEYQQTDIGFLDGLLCRQLVFWSAKAEFPLTYTAIHIWDKTLGISQYERVFERNGSKSYRVLRGCPPNNAITARMVGDDYTGHPSQKPVKLLRRLIEDASKSNGLVLDPFMGSGSTLRAAKDVNRRAIGIEVEERWCEAAALRMHQDTLGLTA